jgi:ribose transport system permease protein/L-arabinose transport system permease protein
MVITAVLLGGTSLHGGEGSVVRTLLGVLIIGVLNNGMVLTSVPSFYQIIANGTLLLAAVVIDQIRNGAHKGPIES